MTSIAETANVLIQGITVGQEIYQTVLNAMDSMQKTQLSGESKKVWVVAFIKNFLTSINENWENWINIIITFIDFSKSFYNKFK